MRCSDCCDGPGAAKCAACKHMQQEGRWKWRLDNGNRYIECPDCGFSMTFGAYRYSNPFNFCPHCGARMITGRQMTMKLDGDDADDG